jgi:hypothetical protein
MTMKWQPCQYRPESTANSDNLNDEPETAEKDETSMSMRVYAPQHNPSRDASHARGRRFETRRAHREKALQMATLFGARAFALDVPGDLTRVITRETPLRTSPGLTVGGFRLLGDRGPWRFTRAELRQRPIASRRVAPRRAVRSRGAHISGRTRTPSGAPLLPAEPRREAP